eukprot:gene33163-55747_t
MGPRGTSCSVERFDATTGGAFRYTIGAGGGAGYTFFGSYHEVAPGRIVHTWEFEGDPGRPTFETLRIVPLADGRCALEGTSVYTSVEHCAEMLDFDESGEGMDENFERLDEVERRRRQAVAPSAATGRTPAEEGEPGSVDGEGRVGCPPLGRVDRLVDVRRRGDRDDAGAAVAHEVELVPAEQSGFELEVVAVVQQREPHEHADLAQAVEVAVDAAHGE